jgi:hypothetical protein
MAANGYLTPSFDANSVMPSINQWSQLAALELQLSDRGG